MPHVYRNNRLKLLNLDSCHRHDARVSSWNWCWDPERFLAHCAMGRSPIPRFFYVERGQFFTETYRPTPGSCRVCFGWGMGTVANHELFGKFSVSRTKEVTAHTAQSGVWTLPEFTLRGNFTVCYGQWPIEIDFIYDSPICLSKMDMICHSYVESPETSWPSPKEGWIIFETAVRNLDMIW
jgi:hypothetical protein